MALYPARLMGASGPHDDFDTARKLTIAVYANFNVDQDVDELERKISDDLEWVSRDGTFGKERFLEMVRTQKETWDFETEVGEIIDAGEGALIVLTTFKRIDRETGKVAWKAWPAIVLRVHEGKLVFFEGYIDSRKALAALGVEQG